MWHVTIRCELLNERKVIPLRFNSLCVCLSTNQPRKFMITIPLSLPVLPLLAMQKCVPCHLLPLEDSQSYAIILGMILHSLALNNIITNKDIPGYLII